MSDDAIGDDAASDADSTTSDQPVSYTAWLDALEAGEGFALESPTGERSLPPRRVDPATGATELRRKPLAETGTIETYTVVHVAAPGFADDTPYVSAIADFGHGDCTRCRPRLSRRRSHRRTGHRGGRHAGDNRRPRDRFLARRVVTPR